MSFDPVYVKPPRPEMISGLGIGASNSPTRLIEILGRFGLVPNGLSEPLKQLAASGQQPGNHWKVPLWQLDQVLQRTDAPISNRLAFKASLDTAGLLDTAR